MTIFHPTITRNGRTTKAKTWSIRYRNAAGKLVPENGFKTKDEASVRLRDAKREVQEERAGIRTPRIQQNEKPLAEHRDDFRQSLEDRAISPAQLQLVDGRLERLFEATEMERLSDLNANKVQSYLAALRKKGTSQQTCKHIVRHVKQFASFLLDDDRIEADPFRKLRPPKVSERRHRRRALSPEECRRLCHAAENSKTMYGLSGPDQAALFRTALNTGYRASELSRLAAANLHLDGDHPHISLAGKDTKNRDEARIPLRDPEFVQYLTAWSAGKLRDGLLWPGTWASSRGACLMVREAQKAAKIQYEVDGRKADFHALRYTFITNLIKSGESPAYVQRLARHSDINLTFRVYTDLGLEDLYHGRLRTNQPVPALANGTRRKRSKKETSNVAGESSDEGDGAKSVAPNVAPVSVPERLPTSPDDTAEDGREQTNSPNRRTRRKPQRQEATGDNSSCRPVSQTVLAEREGHYACRLAID